MVIFRGTDVSAQWVDPEAAAGIVPDSMKQANISR
jgi:hypothetical protein